MGVGYRLGLFLALSFQLVHTVSHANSVVILDVDDTLLSTGEVHGGSFGTPRILRRIENRGQTIIPYPADLPATIEVSPGKYRYLRDRNLLGAGEQMVGSMQKSKNDDGTTIYPGYYWLDPSRSYEYFREGAPGKNHLLKHFKIAEAQDKKMTWKGPTWDLMVKLLSTKETAKTLMILTARGHSRAEWMEFFRYLKRQGYIDYLPNPDQIIAVSRPEYHYLSPSGDPFEAKYNKIVEIAEHLGGVVPDPVGDVRIHPWGARVESLAINSLVFADDNQRCSSRVRELMVKLTREGRHRLKFVLVNAGLESHFRETKLPYQPKAAVVRPDGSFRKASLAEQMGLSNDCAQLIGLAG